MAKEHDHLRWLSANGYREDNITIQDLLRYLALCGAHHYGPLGRPWRATPLGESARAVRAACLKSYYVDLTTRENVNAELRATLSMRRLHNSRDRDRSMVGHHRLFVALSRHRAHVTVVLDVATEAVLRHAQAEAPGNSTLAIRQSVLTALLATA